MFKPPKPEPLPKPVTIDETRLALEDDEKIRRRRGFLANVLVGKRARPGGAGVAKTANLGGGVSSAAGPNLGNLLGGGAGVGANISAF